MRGFVKGETVKVAIVHDWLTGMRGGERVLEILCELYPDAPVYTLFYNPARMSKAINERKIRTSFLQKLPFSLKMYRRYLPLFPIAVEQFDLREYDVVISSSHCVAKGALTTSDTLHICYCYTPLRYAWDMYEEYFGKDRISCVERSIIRPIINYLRVWDVASSRRVDCFAAISHNVARRIEKYYRREAQVIHPPVDTSFFMPGNDRGNFFLVVSAMVPYKRVEIVVDAFNKLGLPLKVVGGGPLRKKIERKAKRNVEFLGEVSDRELLGLYQRCRALVFAGVEDFGIAPLEAQAAGRPVIAYGRGGFLETVVEGKTGIFFNEQSSFSLIDAVRKFQKMDFDPELIRNHALQFDTNVFRQKIHDYVEKRYQEWTRKRRGVFSP